MKAYPSSAEGWMTFLLQNEASKPDLEALEAWRRQDPQNGFELDLLQKGWQVAARLQEQPEMDRSQQQPETQRWNAVEGGGGLRPRLGLLLAAGLAIIVGLSFWLSPRSTVSEYHTAKGEQLALQLQDGTEITLNTDTTLGVASHQQRVDLHGGEAFFKVSPRDRGSFVVDAGAVEVRVLGTEFNVLRRMDRVLISVPEGTVEVRAQPSSDGSETESYRLTVGQVLEIRGPQRQARYLTDLSELKRVQAWRAGKIELDKTSLADAVAELSRYTPIAVEIAEPALEDFKVSGVFHIDRMADLEAFVFAIESSLPIEARRSEDKVELFHAG